MILSTLTLLAAIDAFDVCVVGAGPVGLALGLSLARRFRRVLILESGGNEPDRWASELAETELADPGSHARPGDSIRRGLGGTSRAWGAGCTPYDPIDFQGRPYVPLSAAPISFADVAMYHAEACNYLGCGGPEFDLGEDPPGGRLRSSGVIRFATEPDMGKRHRAELEASPYLRVCLRSTATRLHFDPGSGKITAVEVRSGDQTTVVRAPVIVLACGGIETARLLLRIQAEHPAFLGGPAGPLGRYYMGHVSGHVARMHFSDSTMGAHFSFFRSTVSTYFRRRITFAPEVLEENRLLNIYFVPDNFPLEDAGMKSGALSALHLGLSARHRTLAVYAALFARLRCGAIRESGEHRSPSAEHSDRPGWHRIRVGRNSSPEIGARKTATGPFLPQPTPDLWLALPLGATPQPRQPRYSIRTAGRQRSAAAARRSAFHRRGHRLGGCSARSAEPSGPGCGLGSPELDVCPLAGRVLRSLAGKGRIPPDRTDPNVEQSTGWCG